MACLFSINYNNLPLNLTYIYYSRNHSSTSTTTTREANRIELDGQERLIFGFVILDSKITISYPGDHHHDNDHHHQPLAAATNEHGSPGFVRDRAELLESIKTSRWDVIVSVLWLFKLKNPLPLYLHYINDGLIVVWEICSLPASQPARPSRPHTEWQTDFLYRSVPEPKNRSRDFITWTCHGQSFMMTCVVFIPIIMLNRMMMIIMFCVPLLIWCNYGLLLFFGKSVIEIMAMLCWSPCQANKWSSTLCELHTYIVVALAWPGLAPYHSARSGSTL